MFRFNPYYINIDVNLKCYYCCCYYLQFLILVYITVWMLLFNLYTRVVLQLLLKKQKNVNIYMQRTVRNFLKIRNDIIDWNFQKLQWKLDDKIIVIYYSNRIWLIALCLWFLCYDDHEIVCFCVYMYESLNQKHH